LRRWLPPSSDWFGRFLENGRQTERPPWRSPRRGNDAAHGLSRRRCAGAELKQERKRNGSESEPEEGSRCRTGRGRLQGALAGRRGVRGSHGRAVDRLAQEGPPGGRVPEVAKNTLVSRAVEGTDYAVIQDELTGPLLFAFSQEDPGAAGRLIKDFAKTADKLRPRLVSLGGQKYPGSHVDVLASLPTREQALAMLVGLIAQPATMLARVLAEPAAQTARVIN